MGTPAGVPKMAYSWHKFLPFYARHMPTGIWNTSRETSPRGGSQVSYAANGWYWWGNHAYLVRTAAKGYLLVFVDACWAISGPSGALWGHSGSFWGHWGQIVGYSGNHQFWWENGGERVQTHMHGTHEPFCKCHWTSFCDFVPRMQS